MVFEIVDSRGQGVSYHSCAAKLNALGIKNARKQSWYGSSVRNVMNRTAI